MRSFKTSRKGLPLLFCAAAVLPLCANPLEETVSTLEQWVETERKISEASSGWEAEKASMLDLIKVYREEAATLDEIITAAEKDTSAAEARRAELLEQDSAVKEIEGQLIAQLEAIETTIKSLEISLPEPLHLELAPLFSAIPEDPSSTKLAIGQRIQPIVAILTQVQKFNQVVTVVEGFREFEAGRTIQTEKIYFGLGAAFYVDQTNEHAGYGVPGPDGWTWTDDNSLIADVRTFLDIYRGTRQATYVELPVSVN